MDAAIDDDSFSAGVAALAFPREDERLVDAARGGDRHAFESLYAQHVGRVYAICLRLTANVQNTLSVSKTVTYCWRIDDLQLARRCLEVGLAGFVLKSHYAPTAERAAVVRAAVPGVHALGAIALNAGVGGLNAQAVEIAARGGARIVWLPTVDSENEASEDGPKPAKQPVWRKIQDEFVAARGGGRAGAGERRAARAGARGGRAAPARRSQPGISDAPRSTRPSTRRSRRESATSS